MLRKLNQSSVSNLVDQKFDVDLVVLLSDIFVPTLIQSMLPIESKVDSLLCSKSVVIFLVPLFTTMHLFVNLLMFTPMTVTLM